MANESKKGFYAVLGTGFVAVAAALLFVGFQIQDLARKDLLADVERLNGLIDARIEPAIAASWDARQESLKKMMKEQANASIDALIAQAKSEPTNAVKPAAAPAAKEEAPSPVPKVTAKDHLLGKRDARITLIEYSDYECPFCKQFHTTAHGIVRDFGGQVNWVYRHFPLSFHNPNATQQAMAAECAGELGGNAKFWEYSDKIYERTRSDNGFPATNLVPLAEELGLNAQTFKDCLDSQKYASRVDADMQGGLEAGVRGTPGSFLVDNKTGRIVAIKGAQPYSNVKAAVERMLQER